MAHKLKWSVVAFVIANAIASLLQIGFRCDSIKDRIEGLGAQQRAGNCQWSYVGRRQ